MTRSIAAGRRAHGSTAGTSLFPFLAVLICTMGALIVLLVVIARQARVAAAQAAAVEQSASTPAPPELEEMIRGLQAARASAETELTQARLTLAQVEDHARQLRGRLAELAAHGAELDRKQEASRRQLLEKELARVEADLAEAKSLLDDARSKAGTRRTNYAVVPYEGPNGTHRRPIYVECRAECVILQPEGITFDAADFNGPLAPGNPLDAALRAAREHLLAAGQFDTAQGEPYPLFLVRPGGVAAYAAAREATRSWGTEFGFELIEEDWRLAFGPPDPALAEVLQQTAAAARVRQARLAAALPPQYRGRGPARYRVAPGGGVQAVDEAGDPLPEGAYRHAPSEPRFGRAADASGEQAGEATAADGGSRTAAVAKPPAPKLGEWSPPSPASTNPAEVAEREQPAAAQPVRSLAETRGRDWSLPAEARAAVPLIRPMRVDCFSDRLVLTTDGRAGRGREIAMGPRTEEAVDELVASAWEATKAWGMAGQRMYWRPTLSVHVAPGGEQRFAEIEALMRDSGLDVKRASGEQVLRSAEPRGMRVRW